MIRDYLNESFDETVEKHGEVCKESHLMDYLSIGRDQFPVPGDKNDGRLMCYVDAPFVMQSNMVRYTGGELTMGKGFPVVAWGKPEMNMKSLAESDLVGVVDIMPIMFWVCNFLGEGIVVDWLDNKSPSPEEQGGKTPSSRRAMYVNVRLVNITMGNKCSVNPMVYKWLLLKVTCGGVVSKCCINGLVRLSMLRLVAPQECVGVYIVGVFRLDRDPSLFSWWRKILSLANANCEWGLTKCRKV
jgi:hypothetical protein